MTKKKAAKKKASSKSQKLRIVAIGASAGGLEALEQLFKSMPDTTGLTFIIIQHLSPDFHSMMDELLSRHTKMAIHQIKEGTKILPNMVYLNPPRMNMSILDGYLHLKPPSDDQVLNLPIDIFMSSLAKDQGEEAIGIILSGTGSDGSQGARAISQIGGVMLVQDPSTAKFDSMPRTAIERGLATMVAAPDNMANILSRLLKDGKLGDGGEGDLIHTDPNIQIIELLKKRYGIDFSYYKVATVDRRIQRRSLLSRIEDLADYAVLLNNDAAELEALYHDLLIGVTSFFRDREAFKSLEENSLEELVDRMTSEKPLRVWMPGSSSGEEAYSLAIMLTEIARRKQIALNVKIFATDVHFRSIEAASSGLYQKDDLKTFDEDLIERYFNDNGSSMQVHPDIRKMIVFSVHNLIKDPPFTRMDLVICRNLLIYFNEVAQRKVIALFHFSLNRNGHLFLGSSETTGPLSDEFIVLDKRWRLYRKRRDIRLAESNRLLQMSTRAAIEREERAPLRDNRMERHNYVEAFSTPQRTSLMNAYDKILEIYAPTSLLVKSGGELVHIFGATDKYLHLGQGRFSQNITDMVLREMRLTLATGLEWVRMNKKKPFRRDIRPTKDGELKNTVTVKIEPLDGDGAGEIFHLITLSEPEVKTEAKADTKIRLVPQAGDIEEVDLANQRIHDLERDLRFTEESLQSTIEELEASNEELQATNEEMMASNEELQATNEELHSVNEELYTVSAEHQRKIDELTELTNDMDNLLTSTEIGTVFLDSDLNIRRFTPAIAETFNLLPNDMGRPIDHITPKFSHQNLMEDLHRVKEGGGKLEQSVTVDDHSYLMRILPYKTGEKEMDGIVITLVDVTQLKQAEDEIARQRLLYQQIVNEQPDMVCRTLADNTITFANRAFKQFFEDKKPVIGRTGLSYLSKKKQKSVQTQLSKLRPDETMQMESELSSQAGETRWIEWRVKAFGGHDGKVLERQAVGRDVTDAKQQRLLKERLNQLSFRADIDDDLRLKELLKIGSDYFGLNIGVLSKVKQNKYEVLQVVGGGSVLKGGACFPLEETMSKEVVKSGYPISHEDLTEQPPLLHPALKDQNISGYLGAPIYVDGGIFGTLCFLSTSSSVRPIGHDDSLVIAMLSQWVGHELTRQIKAVALLDLNTKLSDQNDDLAGMNDNLRQFTHIVSHDLKAPLRAIIQGAKWITEDIDEQASADEIKKHAERVQSQAIRLSDMLTGLLEYSRVGSDQRKLVQVETQKLLNDIVQMIEPRAGIEIQLADDLPKLKTFHSPLQLVFLNLIENAVKYHNKKKGVVKVRGDELDDHFLFKVEDNGPGIEKKQFEKIFLPFQKLEASDKVPGYGMGLALVQKTIKNAGGRIDVSSKGKNKGVIFSFTWPKKIRG